MATFYVGVSIGVEADSEDKAIRKVFDNLHFDNVVFVDIEIPEDDGTASMVRDGRIA